MREKVTHMQHKVCVCVCVSRRLRNTPTTDLIKVCVSSLLGIYCHSVR